MVIFLLSLMFFGTIKVVAQEIPNSDIRVYLNTPIVGEGYFPVVNGQTVFTYKFSNVDMTTFSQSVSNFRILLYSSPSATNTPIGELFIVENFQDTYDQYLWHFKVDTNDYQNTNYYVKIFATNRLTGTDYYFLYGSDNLAFGPIEFRNHPFINEPQLNSFVAGDSVRLTATINGLVQSVNFKILNSTNIIDSLDANEAISFLAGLSHWSTNWDSTKFENGIYHVKLSFTTLSGKIINDVFEEGFNVENQESQPEVIPPTCTDPQWSCPVWPECPSTLIRSRVCTTTNCTPNYSQTFTESCTYIAPPANTNTNTNTITVPTQTNTNTVLPQANTNTNPSNNTNTTESIPIINMQYPGQGDVVSGDALFKAITNINIASLEFYYKKIDSDIEEFIGIADRSTSNSLIWQRIWGTDDKPNGEYYVYSKATMPNGYIYQSDMIIIIIDHENYTTKEDTPIEDLQYVVPEKNVVDEDGDGINNEIEETYDSNPNLPNIDPEDVKVLVDKAISDGKLTQEMGDRIKSGYIIEQPKTSKLSPSIKINVIKIENYSPRLGKNNLIITGNGPANTTLKLYIYSDPIVVTTKTDASGNFTYTLDKDLLDGKHEVYVTINDDTGKITEQSAPLSFFVRRAQAVTEEEYLRGDVNISSDSSSVVNKYIIPGVISIVALILVFLGIILIKRKEKIN